ncbi:hypothetical protein [Streptomyces sp. BE133]|uniref:hypothetical protein n=1 Tax=Streptomyces sp. BE133 TaxID=3002523 RepID=UPI002E79FD4D|nr:hypothetical protein [Streptomyces sp. BE133]MEE1808059.1 hypothetical protein [Streptomyces sp. BE133]
MAAVLGAVVGSVATGGAAFVTSLGAARLQTRKERKEGCLALMNEAAAVLHLTEDVMIHATAERGEARTPDYAQFTAQSLEGRRRVAKTSDVLVLAGPRGVKDTCDALTEAASAVHLAIRRGDETLLAEAVDRLMQSMDALRQRGPRI